jgi:hypothetical protein
MQRYGVPGYPQEGKGSGHDFKIYKDTIGKSAGNSIALDADLWYLGIEEYHSNSFISVKPCKKHITNGSQGGALSLNISIAG